MMRSRLVPTRLVDAKERPPIELVAQPGANRFRTLRVLFSLLRMLVGFGWLRLRGKLTWVAAGKRTRDFLEKQGFLWIKLGQLLSLRTDVFSVDFCRELSNLQFQARGFAPELARRTLEEELGGPLDRYFAEFDARPFAAASISQVHRAVLKRNGAPVVVKVQRPDVGWMFNRDIALIRALIGAVRRLGVASYMRWDDMLWELNEIIFEEIDYRYETSNLRRMRRNLRAHQVYVPEVFEEVSSSRVLVMEFIQGTLMSDFIAMKRSAPERVEAWLKENNISARTVGRRLYLSFLRQLLEENLFHGDLHPGNIILLRNSCIAFIDLGTVGSVESDFLNRYLMYMQALARHQYKRAAELTLLSCPDLPPIDPEELKERLAQCIREWDLRSGLPDAPYSERSMETLATQSNQVLFESRVAISMMYLRMARSWGTLDASLAHLIPEADYAKLIDKYFRGAQKRSRQGTRLEAAVSSTMQAFESVAGVSQIVGPMLCRSAMMFQKETTRLEYCLGTLFGSLRLAVALVGLVWLFRLLEGKFESGTAGHVLERLDRLAGIMPVPANPSLQLLGCLALFAACLALGKIQRRLLQDSVR